MFAMVTKGSILQFTVDIQNDRYIYNSHRNQEVEKCFEDACQSKNYTDKYFSNTSHFQFSITSHKKAAAYNVRWDSPALNISDA